MYVFWVSHSFQLTSKSSAHSNVSRAKASCLTHVVESCCSHIHMQGACRVCCSVCVAVCVLQCVLQCACCRVCCSVCCSMLQSLAYACTIPKRLGTDTFGRIRESAMFTLQHALQHTATHTATGCYPRNWGTVSTCANYLRNPIFSPHCRPKCSGRYTVCCSVCCSVRCKFHCVLQHTLQHISNT